MNTVKQFVVDAFAGKTFEGNPAAVCVLDSPLPDDLMQHIAEENRFSETAFVIREDEAWNLRWFTPGGEIDLCGHATLATAFVLLNYYTPGQNSVVFLTKSGKISVRRTEKLYAMDFPVFELRQVEVTPSMSKAAGAVPVEAWMGRDLICIFDDEKTVRELTPDQNALRQLEGLLFHATARGSVTDCVSRTFAPKLNVEEDPVCGSGHCHIAPYWAAKLGKNELTAYQASQRGGTLHCHIKGNIITLSGTASLYSIGELYIE